ncbi:unnamed protein product [Dovyalis caffra]|uniref:F-box associated beta-propeller type 3 domain-containing protein n=1 Tax=Dovyalis caffra TaxID=77055 RepID=A0AAV1S4P6_9ROSI|nr:unnamed protein product [Dovyalis caffra]
MVTTEIFVGSLVTLNSGGCGDGGGGKIDGKRMHKRKRIQEEKGLNYDSFDSGSQTDMEDGVQYKRSGKYYISPKIALWNPSTKKFHILPFTPIRVTTWSPLYGIRDDLKVQYAFGHDSVKDDYKVLRIVLRIPAMVDPDEFILQVMVYSLRGDSWRAIVAPNYLRFIVGLEYVLVCDAFHWLLIQGQYQLNIVAFDIQREEYYTVPLPNLESNSAPSCRNLSVIGQWLCLTSTNAGIGNVDIWVMKEYGVKESWVKLFLLDQSSSEYYSTVRYNLVPFAYVKDSDDHKVLLKVLFDQSLMWYDLRSKTYEHVEIPGAPWIFHACSFVGSLVSPLPPMKKQIKDMSRT